MQTASFLFFATSIYRFLSLRTHKIPIACLSSASPACCHFLLLPENKFLFLISIILPPSSLEISCGSGHQFKKLRIFREGIFKRHDIPGTPDQPMASAYIGNIGQLVIGNVQKPCQFFPVRTRLIQQDQEFTVGKHQSCCIGLQELLHVLS